MISVYTPTHNPKFLAEAYQSLKDQTYTDWEWVICDDGSEAHGWQPADFLDKAYGKYEYEYKSQIIQEPFEIEGEIPPEWEYTPDKFHIKVYYFQHTGLVGWMKRACTERCSGDILVELDHDDMLTSNCLEEIAKTFEDPEIGMVYSNAAEFMDHGCNKYNAPYWKDRYYTETYKGRTYDVAHFPDIYGETFAAEMGTHGMLRQNILEWGMCPNHVRAYRKSELERLGGYNHTLRFADDYDLTCRFFTASKIAHIDKMLYLYRWGGNSHQTNYEEVQRLMAQVRATHFG